MRFKTCAARKTRSLLRVNDEFTGKRKAESLCKRVEYKVYFVILQRVKQNLGNQIHFLAISGVIRRLLLYTLLHPSDSQPLRGLTAVPL